jgi:GAF domain-containing protein
MTDRGQLVEELLDIGLALTTEHDLYALLERILDAARRFTRAEGGTLFLREGDHLRFAIMQNDFLQQKLGTVAMQQRLQSEPLRLTEPSLAGHVAQTGEIVNVADAYAIGVHETRALNRRFDAASEYSTRSVLAVPLQDLTGGNVGVLELLNALDESGAIVPFDPDDEKVIRALASQAAVAIRNARLEDRSFKDASTELYNHRYFALRIDEEVKRLVQAGYDEAKRILTEKLDDLHTLAKALLEVRGNCAAARQALRSFTIIARLEADGSRRCSPIRPARRHLLPAHPRCHRGAPFAQGSVTSASASPACRPTRPRPTI